MKIRFYILIVLSLFGIPSCNDSNKSAIKVEQDLESAQIYTLQKITDTGRPFIYVLTFTDVNGTSIPMNYESESVDDINLLIGKKVKVKSDSEQKMKLIDILLDEKSIMGMESGFKNNTGKPMPDWKSITGVFSAKKEVEGEIFGELSVKGETENLQFKEIVTKKMMSLTGKQVTAFYRLEKVITIDTIHKIE